jgi:Translocon-associated protein beta (TRAPB)
MAGGARAFMLAIILVLLTSCALRVARADDVDVAAVLSEEEDEYVDPSAEVAQQATLVVHKRITQRYLVKGRNMTVQVAMYNVGNGCASFALPLDAASAHFSVRSRPAARRCLVRTRATSDHGCTLPL